MSLLINTEICKADQTIIDEYDFTMSLKVPRVYNNTQSLGYRKDQKQKIKGTLKIIYKEDELRPTLEITNLVNITHKINDKNITYQTTVDNEGEIVYPRFNYIGNNKTGKFNKAKIIFYFDANPSYNIGEDEPDNSLLVTLSGTGNTKIIKQCNTKIQIVNIISGFVTGTLGCGCSAYGHVSPTRIVGPYGPICDAVDDVCAIVGEWKAKFKQRYYK
jgi:hypothetical protein